jgi:hypothetical protein
LICNAARLAIALCEATSKAPGSGHLNAQVTGDPAKIR